MDSRAGEAHEDSREHAFFGALVRVPERGRVRPVRAFAVNVNQIRARSATASVGRVNAANDKRAHTHARVSPAPSSVGLFPPHDDANDLHRRTVRANDSLHYSHYPESIRGCFRACARESAAGLIAVRTA